MEQLQACVDRLVSVGIQSYIGLLCCGEEKRSRQLLKDVLQLSGLSHGGPSAKVRGGPHGVSYMLMYFTIRGVLASLLVLRATAYWRKVPDLAHLHRCSRRLADALEDQVGISPTEASHAEVAERAWVAGSLSGEYECCATACSAASDCGRHAPRPGVGVAL